MSRMLLKKRGEDLDEKSHQKLISLFELCPSLERAWELKEEFRDILQMDDITEAAAALKRWYQEVSNSKLTPFMRIKQTIKESVGKAIFLIILRPRLPMVLHKELIIRSS